MLLCDFHIHTNYSDGSLELRKTIDLFGQAGFDVIAITDHVVNGKTTYGKLANRFRVSIREDNFNAYLDHVAEEGKRAWDRYGLLVLPGVEITKSSLYSDQSAHVLLIDIKTFVSAAWDYEKIFLEAKKQDALIIACHPHHSSELTSIDTLYLWNNRKKYARYIDAWEIANRDDVFNVISLKKYPYIAGSDFHRARHLYSWKTMLDCDKEIKAIKQCIRYNRGVAITLFRNGIPT
jgi:predicted metal-dependent phosphoesterase TrpH